MKHGAVSLRKLRGRFGVLGLVVPLMLCLGACNHDESEADPHEELDDRDASKEERYPSGWIVLDGGALFSPSGLLVPQGGQCPEGWRLVSYQPGCLGESPAMMCAHEEKYGCLELRCSCRGSIVSGCKTFEEPFSANPVFDSSNASVRVGDSCEPSE